MTSTMLALMVVAVWMGCVMAEGKEASCNVENIQSRTDLDLSRMSGTWYVTYRSHVPSVLQDVKLAHYTVQFNGSLVLPYSYTIIPNTGVCTVMNGESIVDPNNSGLWRNYPTAGMMQTVHTLAVDDDYEIVAVWEEMFINGERNDDLSTIDIVVRDPTKEPNMAVLADALRQFCGEEATSLGFYDHFNYDTSAECVQ